MNSIKKTIITLAAVAVVAAGSVSPAMAKSKWKRGLATGVGVGIGLGVAGALLNGGPRYRERDRVVYVERPRCYIEQEPLYDSRGRVAAYRDVKVCR